MKDSKPPYKRPEDKSWDAFLKGVTPLKPQNQIPFALAKTVPVKKTSAPLSTAFEFEREVKPLPKVSRKDIKRVHLEGRLDLHGLTQGQGYAALLKFVEGAVAHEKKTVLVITGKGALENPETLNKLLPRWCETNPLSQLVKSIAHAKVEHGGRGAYYVFLRKLK
ncbi:Smr/MutS family protein [Candidatus Bealeia paramacronuclearis]|uniref:Smr/MutS family protein n=1 Tax=Candidatus Bealeia paramacronuclearis TaxID=1921001 RepID=A0ABZ2C222_9PROT|nr:Smr/MutS family protein [Candidatus Bealeia paramacronuclearis]